MYKEKKLLILDDEKIVTSTLKTLLSLEGFTDTHFFNSPLEAVDFLKDNQPDLIISDFVMPEMNGLEFLKEAKNLYPETCMILLTGYADNKNGKNFGRKGSITKNKGRAKTAGSRPKSKRR